MTSPIRVLLNKNFSVTAAQIEALLQEQGGRAAYQVWASHSDPANGMLAATPHTLLEPAGLLGDDYAAWLLETCRQHGIQLLWAGKERELLADWQERFAEAGVQLVVASSRQIQDELESKDEFLNGWDETILPVPRWQAFSTPAEFEAAYAALKTDGRRLCVKPARGIYASGFRVLEEVPSLDGFLGGSLYTMSVAAARELFSAPQFPTMLLMHVLEGAERSVDCVAWEGQLIRAVVRRKFGLGQVIEYRPDLVEAARRVAEHYQLSGIFNFQTKDQDGHANMLEINARASGGLRYSMAAGVNFLRLGLDAATGQLDWNHLPEVRTGFQVYEDKTVRAVEGLPHWHKSDGTRESRSGGSQ